MNALLLPFVLGCLYCLARIAPPQPLRLQGIYAFCVALAFLIVGGVGLYAADRRLGWLICRRRSGGRR